MLKMKQYIYGCLCLLALLLTACNNERDSLVPTGMLYLNVGTDQTVLTKAEIAVTNEKLKVYIINSEEDTTTYSDYISELRNKKLVLPAGTYKIAVSSNQSQDAAWETPFYAGETEVEVKAGEITNAKVVCRIANTKVSVTYSEGVSQYFIDYNTTVSNSSGYLLYLRDEYRAGFFAPEKLTADLKLINKDGNAFTLHRVFTDIKERYHYILNFKIGEDTEDEAGADFDISVDDKAETVEVTITIKEEDLDNNSAPKLTLTGFIDNKISFKKTEDPVITSGSLHIKLAHNLQCLGVTIDSEQPELSIVKSFDLMKLDPATKTVLTDLDFPGLDLSKQNKKFDLNFDAFAKHLDPLPDNRTATHTITFFVMDDLNQETEIKIIYEVKPDVQIMLLDPNPWAKFVVLKANTGDTEKRAFWIRKRGEAEYRKIEENIVVGKEGDFSVIVKDLLPKTGYEYYATSGEASETTPASFTTEDTPTVPNLSFDDWCKSGKSWMPNVEGGTTFWDSGNKGANSLSEANPTSKEVDSNFLVKKENNLAAAKLESKTVAGVFAAGNVYTGNFIRAIIAIPAGAELNFGQPYIGRPTTLSGYYMYQPRTMNKEYNELASGDLDKCSIYIALCDWKSQFKVNTQTGTFVDLNGKDIIAYGALSDLESNPKSDMTEYKPFKINIEYRDDRKPTYVLIVASASKYGDYFAGGVGSTLYIDEFEFSFDYNEASLPKNR